MSPELKGKTPPLPDGRTYLTRRYDPTAVEATVSQIREALDLASNSDDPAATLERKRDLPEIDEGGPTFKKRIGNGGKGKRKNHGKRGRNEETRRRHPREEQRNASKGKLLKRQSRFNPSSRH